MPPGRLWSVAGRQVMSTFGRPRVRSTSSRASAPQPTTRTRGGRGSRNNSSPLLIDQAPRHVGGDPRVAAVRVRPNGRAELLVEWRPAHLQGVGREEARGDEGEAVAEAAADVLPPRHERIVEYSGGRPAAAQEDVGALDDLGLEAVVEVVVHLFGQLVVRQRREVDVL